MSYKFVAISYGDEQYSKSLKLNLWTAKHIGKVDYVIGYGPKDIDDNFYKTHFDILSQKRGGGYWIWKPYVILKTLETLNDGDYLFYTDAGMIYSHDVRVLIEHMNRDQQDICLSSGFVPAKDWCKRDCFILMGCDNEEAHNRIMVSGGYVLVKKSKRSIEFVTEWLKYAVDSRASTDKENELGYPNLPGFREHRHDQAILSNLCYLYGVEPYKAMSHVDEPRAHRKAIKGVVGAYGYSFEERIEMIKRQHESVGYKHSCYPRLFINTRIKNCGTFIFILKLIKMICKSMATDVWGWFFDGKYV